MAAGGVRRLWRRVTRALLAQSEEPAEDTRLCEVSGPAFTGILPLLERQEGYPPLGQAGPDRPILKVIMVHGVGTHVPGYGARLSANLAQALGLTVIAPEPKEFTERRAPACSMRATARGASAASRSPWARTGHLSAP